MRGVTVYVDGVPKEVDLGLGKSGSVFPSAVLDSGVPVILTTTSIANAIYGALGVGPASDGNCEYCFFLLLFSCSFSSLRHEVDECDSVQTTYHARLR